MFSKVKNYIQDNPVKSAAIAAGVVGVGYFAYRHFSADTAAAAVEGAATAAPTLAEAALSAAGTASATVVATVAEVV